MTSKRPVVLVFGGTDPTGGAGISADIGALSSLGCHCAPVITAVTAQDTTEVKEFAAVPTDVVIAQARAILEDMPIAAIKTGMLVDTEIISAVTTICHDYPQIPVIVDPILNASDGTSLSNDDLGDAYRSLLLPHALLVTPNKPEAQELATQGDTLDACAAELLSLGCDMVLLTGTHDSTVDVVNRLYQANGDCKIFNTKRLPHNYHGSGCTLASACAAGLAQGIHPFTAIEHALEYTRKTLEQGYRLGMGQYLPNRFFWSDANKP